MIYVQKVKVVFFSLTLRLNIGNIKYISFISIKKRCVLNSTHSKRLKKESIFKMKKIFKVKSSNAVTLQVFGIAGVILATFISFAYLMPENSTSSETVTPTVIETSLVSSTISETTLTNTTTKAVTKVSTKNVTSSATSTATVTSTATTSISMAETTTSYVTTESSETSVITSAPEVTETTTADLYSSLDDWSYDYETEPLVTEKYYSETKLVFTEPYNDYSYNDSDNYDAYDNSDDYNYDDDNSDTDKNDEEKEPEGVYLGRYKITHYCACSSCCGEYTGLTASGTVATAGRTASASSEFEFGTKVEIDGNVYVVEDRGGFSENTIDIFCDSHQEALEKGSYYTDVYIIYED